MKKFLHLDLFSGIGGFALAVDLVWPNSTHIFCDNDLFCQEVLKKHWPNSKIYGDIRTVTDSSSDRFAGGGSTIEVKERYEAHPRHSRELERRFERPYPSITDTINERSVQSEHEERPRQEERVSARHKFGVDLLTGGFPCQ